MLRKIVCLLLIVGICAGLVACAGSGKTANNSTISGSSSTESDSFEEPSDEEPSDEEPSDEEPSDEEPSDEEPSDEEPSDEEPSDEEPSDEELSDEEPSDEEPSDEEPSDEEPSDEEPSDEEPSDEEPSDEEPSDEESSDEESSDEEPSEPPTYRPPFDPGEEEKIYVDTDGKFDYKTVNWNGPSGYNIVIPAKNTEAEKSAKTLQNYFARLGVAVKIVNDQTGETAKEILIGKTNRAASKKAYKENQLEVSVSGSKLVFGGGHDVTVDSAVKKFTRLAPAKGKAVTFSLETDFSSTLSHKGLEGYKYVWGDEFEEAEYDDINWTKWGHTHSMTGTNEIQTSQGRDCSDIGDGRLKLFAINTYNIENTKLRYIVPWAVSHRETMNFVYGYAEIRARVPFFKGAWPSYWGGSACNIRDGGENRFDAYHTEIDVFEIFGSKNTVSPNLHKWYEKFDYAGTYNTGVDHTQWAGTRSYYRFTNDQDPTHEYHLYGFKWTPTEMSMWVDGVEYNTFDISKSWDLDPSMQGFNEPSYLMFNNHVFSEDSSFKPNTVTDNVDMLPAEYFIDWYRVYQLDDGKSKIYIDETPTREDRPVLEDKSLRR